LSGIGSAEHLQGLRIPVIHDSPAVGRHMREHWCLTMQYRLARKEDSQNEMYSGLKLIMNALKYLLFHKGAMGWCQFETVAFVRSMQGLDRPDVQIMFAPYSMDLDNEKGGGVSMEKVPGMQIFGYPLRSTSEGAIMIESADPRQAPKISPNYLHTGYDQATSVAMVRYMRELMKQAPLADFVREELPPTAEAQSDDEILEMLRKHGINGFHASGTCKMGVDETAVLDERLRVRGVQGLRVMDGSIFPEKLSANTNGPIMALAWRAADLILEDAP